MLNVNQPLGHINNKPKTVVTKPQTTFNQPILEQLHRLQWHIEHIPPLIFFLLYNSTSNL